MLITSSRKPPVGRATDAVVVAVVVAAFGAVFTDVFVVVAVVVATTGAAGADSAWSGKSPERLLCIIGSQASIPEKVALYEPTESMKKGLCPLEVFTMPAMLFSGSILRRRMPGAEFATDEKTLILELAELKESKRTVSVLRGFATDCLIDSTSDAPVPEIFSRSSTKIGVDTDGASMTGATDVWYCEYVI